MFFYYSDYYKGDINLWITGLILILSDSYIDDNMVC